MNVAGSQRSERCPSGRVPARGSRLLGSQHFQSVSQVSQERADGLTVVRADSLERSGQHPNLAACVPFDFVATRFRQPNSHDAPVVKVSLPNHQSGPFQFFNQATRPADRKTKSRRKFANRWVGSVCEKECSLREMWWQRDAVDDRSALDRLKRFANPHHLLSERHDLVVAQCAGGIPDRDWGWTAVHPFLLGSASPPTDAAGKILS